MAKIRELRGLIYSLYDTEAELAREIGWTRQKINQISNGYREPDINDLNILAHALGKSVGDIAEIFLRTKSPNERHSATVKPHRDAVERSSA